MRPIVLPTARIGNLDDYAYYRRRAAQEEQASRAAACAKARWIHRRLAEAYCASCILFLAKKDPDLSFAEALILKQRRPCSAGPVSSSRADREVASSSFAHPATRRI